MNRYMVILKSEITSGIEAVERVLKTAKGALVDMEYNPELSEKVDNGALHRTVELGEKLGQVLCEIVKEDQHE